MLDMPISSGVAQRAAAGRFYLARARTCGKVHGEYVDSLPGSHRIGRPFLRHFRDLPRASTFPRLARFPLYGRSGYVRSSHPI